MDIFNSKQRSMLYLLSCALSGCDIEVTSIDNWSAVFEEMKKQTVHILVADRVFQLLLTPSKKNEYMRLVALNLRTFHELMIEQRAVTELLSSANIPVVVLKGAASAFYYPVPGYRCMGDIDIIVSPYNYEKAFELLCKNGYINEQDLEEVTRHAGFRTATGFEIELHQYFSYSSNAAQNKILDEYIYRGIEHLERQNVCGYLVPMLPAFENGLVLLAHINQHLSGGLGLRQIIDWMMYVRKELSDEAWKTFYPVAESIGMRTLAETTTRMCKKYLGLRGVTWCDRVDEDLVDELMQYILANGNFGRNYEYKSRYTIRVMHSFINPVSAFRYLTMGGMSHWKIAKKYKFLKPFAWVYQIGHLIRMGLKRDTGVGTFISELKQSNREAEFLKRLGVTKL